MYEHAYGRDADRASTPSIRSNPSQRFRVVMQATLDRRQAAEGIVNLFVVVSRPMFAVLREVTEHVYVEHASTSIDQHVCCYVVGVAGADDQCPGGGSGHKIGRLRIADIFRWTGAPHATPWRQPNARFLCKMRRPTPYSCELECSKVGGKGRFHGVLACCVDQSGRIYPELPAQ